MSRLLMSVAVAVAGVGYAATHHDRPGTVGPAVSAPRSLPRTAPLHAAARGERRPPLRQRSGPRPRTHPRVFRSGGHLHDWRLVARCESSGNWHDNTGNGYYGGLQEDLTFWRSYGGLKFAARPDLATEDEQITVAERGLVAQGIGAWPVCGRWLR